MLVEDGTEVGSDKEMAEVFNHHFINKVRGLCEKVDMNIAEDPLEKMRKKLGPKVPSFDFTEVQVKEVKEVLNSQIP